MKQKGFSEEDIAEITGLSLEETGPTSCPAPLTRLRIISISI